MKIPLPPPPSSQIVAQQNPEKNDTFSLESQIRNGMSHATEVALARKIAATPAAQSAIQAALNTAWNVLLSLHGEKDGTLGIIQAVSPVKNYSVYEGGVVQVPDFSWVGSVGHNGIAIMRVRYHGDLREQCCQFNSLICSQFFLNSLERIANLSDSERGRFSNLIDFNLLLKKNKKNDGDLFRYQDRFKECQSKSRERVVGDTPLESAEYLVANRSLSVPQLKYHLQADGNRAKVASDYFLKSAATATEFAKNNAIPLDDIKIQSGYGKSVWRPASDSDFNKRASDANLPVLAGVSGTTFWFMLAGRILAPGAKAELEIEDDRAWSELMRFALYADLVQDEHHSFVEVNAGAAEQGLEMQWNEVIYLEPFSNRIGNRKFSIGNEEMQNLVRQVFHEETEAAPGIRTADKPVSIAGKRE
ncbi:hypothetical protein ACPUER_35865 [Burkholderia sp. DN3021]|uniref:hypothetical protein n=1 Tax=Burkholderia sp. DN3021 TaxID=3410137 RepID=UPI003C7AF47B